MAESTVFVPDGTNWPATTTSNKTEVPKEGGASIDQKLTLLSLLERGSIVFDTVLEDLLTQMQINLPEMVKLYHVTFQGRNTRTEAGRWLTDSEADQLMEKYADRNPLKDQAGFGVPTYPETYTPFDPDLSGHKLFV